MEAILLTLAVGLGPALVAVIEKLGEKAVEPILKKGLEPFHDWLTQKYDQAKVQEDLHQALIKALDDLRAEMESDPYERLFITNRLTGLETSTHQLLAAAAVEMVQPDPNIIPAEVLSALGLADKQRVLLARFLFFVRKRLADLEGFKTGIQYANDLSQHGLLTGFTADMALVASHTRRTAEGIEALIAYFGIATDDDQVLRAYLETLREQLQFLPLPLADPGTAAKADAELRQIFVPLTIRDMQAEEQSRRRVAQRGQRSSEPDRQDEEINSMVLGDVLTRYTRFALVGGAGSGKTTLLKMAALAFVENRASTDLGWVGEPLFPIFVRLRNFGTFLIDNPKFNEPGPGALTAYLTHHFSESYDLDLTPKFFARQLRTGKCLVLLDGLDEVSQERPEVALQVTAFIQHYGRKGNHFGLASRPRGYESVEEYLRPASLAVCDVNPLDGSGIRRLTENLLSWIVNDPRQLAEDRKYLAQKILSSASLTNLASTPLFCTALTLVYKYHGSDLPQRRVDVLEQIVDLLLGFWTAQKPGLAQKPELAVFDGTGEHELDLEMAVANKRNRLSYLAYQMQIADQKTEVDTATAQAWLQAYLENEEGQDAKTAQKWAKGFLRYAHEHSGLFVEQEGPGIYVFTHEGFREYLAARELIDLGDKAFIETLLTHLLDDRWEQVVLLAAAYKGYSRRARRDLMLQALEKTQTLRDANDAYWPRCMTMTGRMARDMDKYLPAPERKQVEDYLNSAMCEPDLPPKSRATAADILDELGYLPADLHTFVEVSLPPSSFRMGRYPVTNAQYQRFLEADDFAKEAYWRNFPKFSEPDKKTGEITQIGNWGDEGWQWLQKNLDENRKLYPRYWRDPRFGIVRAGVPVVGITWYEANAYCRWLRAHWDEQPEAEQNPDWKPAILRLPTEAEWMAAAGGADPKDRFPWDQAGEITQEETEILRRANIKESGIGRTTPVGMYPLGVSPTGVWDLGGNVWEWQANYQEQKGNWIALRGGAWGSFSNLARLSARHYSSPPNPWYNYGFRLVAPPSG